jgi:hypothetical protein
VAAPVGLAAAPVGMAPPLGLATALVVSFARGAFVD